MKKTMKIKELSTLENKTSFDEGKNKIGLSEDNIKNIESIEKDTIEMFTNLKDYVLFKKWRY